MPRPPAVRSVFVKLVALLLATGASLIVLLVVFFGVLVNRDYTAAVSRMVRDHARLFAAGAPDLAAARALHDRLGYDVRYEGPAGSWTTSEDLPTIDVARTLGASRTTAILSHVLLIQRSPYQLVPAPDGGTYLFSWQIAQRLNVVHAQLAGLLALFVLAVLVAAYTVLRYLLRPLRALTAGVERVGTGELDVVLPERSRDEFGVLTRAFNGMVRRVREMLGARDQLLLDVSHELRSPLTRLKVDLELLPDGVQRARMAEEVAEMESMLGELLELERLRDGRGVRPARHELVGLVRAVAAGYAGRGPGVRFESNTQAVELELDADRIRMLVRNLLDNAVKYSLPDSAPIEVTVLDQGARVLVRVRDDGPGIPEADLPSLFEPFFRVDRSRTKTTGGYGLGLSICRRIAEAHGGTILATNNADRGATFVLQLSRSTP